MKIIVLAFFYMLSSSAFASSKKEPQDIILYHYRFTLKMYAEINAGKFPGNWNEFIGSGVISEKMIEDNRKYLDFENRYRFFNPPILVNDGRSKMNIIIMANQPGHEGSIEQTNDDGEMVIMPGRHIVFEREDGEIDSGKISETRLSKLFTESGLDLTDYTFDASPLLKIDIRIQPDPGDIAIGPARDSASDKSRRALRSLNPFSQRASTASATSDSRPSWVLWLIGSVGGILLITVAAIIFRRKSRSRMARN